jgi:tetratricopeptide (TPR) repeat protein
MKRLDSSALALLAVLALASKARADTPGRHPFYLHALTDLRAARANLERPANYAPPAASWDERTAIAEIDAAIDEIKRAAIWDGKPLSDHPPVDAQLDWRGRTRQSLELLHQAERDIGQAEDNAAVRGLQVRALQHVRAAIHFVEEGRRVMHFDDGVAYAPPPPQPLPVAPPPPPPPPPAQHPAYLHALSDLRAARAHLERPRNYFAPQGANWDEHVAVAEIDAAIDEIKRAAIWDGKPLSDHPPIDAGLDWRGRIHQSLELLHQAERDISQEEDNPAVRGLQQRAREHVQAAIRFTEDGQRRMHFERMDR